LSVLRRLCAAFGAAVLAGTAMAQAAPPGWAARPSQGGTLYAPTDLPAGKVLHVWVSAPFDDTGDGAAALQRQSQRDAREAQSLAGRKVDCQAASAQANGSLMQGCRFSAAAGEPLFAQYVQLPAVVGRSLLVRFVVPDDEALANRYQDGVGDVIKAAAQQLQGDGQPSGNVVRP
jgi:hypothetical protein